MFSYIGNKEITYAGYSQIDIVCKNEPKVKNDCIEMLNDKKISYIEYFKFVNKLKSMNEDIEKKEGKIIKEELIQNFK